MLFCDMLFKSIMCQTVSLAVVLLTLALECLFLPFRLPMVTAFLYYMHFTESTMWLFHYALMKCLDNNNDLTF